MTVRAKPLFGFRPAVEVVDHHSWRDAVNSMIQIAEQYAPTIVTDIAGGVSEQADSIPRWTPVEH